MQVRDNLFFSNIYSAPAKYALTKGASIRSVDLIFYSFLTFYREELESPSIKNIFFNGGSEVIPVEQGDHISRETQGIHFEQHFKCKQNNKKQVCVLLKYEKM